MCVNFLRHSVYCPRVDPSYQNELAYLSSDLFTTTFLPHDAMLARYMLWPRVCVCLSQVGVLLKRLDIGSHKQYHTIALDSSFLLPKISAKFDRGQPLRKHQMQVGWVKIGDFRQITRYISKTVQDRRMISIKVEKEIVCAPSNGDVADDLE